MVVQHEDKHCDKPFVDKVTATIVKVAADAKRSYEVVFIDARKRPCGSKLRQ